MPTVTPQTLNDIILATGKEGQLRAYLAADYPQKKTSYKIDGADVLEVIRVPLYDFVLLRTKNGVYARDYQNEPLPGEALWEDYFLEPFTSSLYRRDTRGSWYDLEGARLPVPVFLKEDVLISLEGKVSRQSWAFGGQQVMVSPHVRLIQVGKLLYDVHLQPVHYFGEKLTGLGRKHVSFGQQDQWQEVCRGKTARAFINEFTGQPLLINDEEIVAHLQHLTRGNHHFEVFASPTRTYVLEGSSTGEIRYDGHSLAVDLTTYLELNGQEVVLVNNGQESFYFDLTTRAPFRLAATGAELISTISHQPVKLPGLALYDITTPHQSFVYDVSHRKPFSLQGEEAPPTSIREVPGFEAYFFVAILDGEEKLCTKHDLRVVRLGEQRVEVAAIHSPEPAKLISARGVRGEKLVLDLRRGIEELSLAKVEGQQIEAVTGPTHRVGDLMLQPVSLASLGGAVPRLVDLEHPELTLFTLPEDLTEYPDQPQPSCFAGNPVTYINFDQPVVVQETSFFRALFLTYQGEEVQVLLRAGNARPVHLDGVGHRNELVVGFQQATINRPYHLGTHVMVAAETLTEALKPGELLFSIHKYQSWLPFFDTYLPVFRRAIPLEGKEYWPCYLFESLEFEGFGEYIAVEREEPYRLLATRKKGKVVPMVVTTKSRALLDPEEVKGLIDLFIDRGMLVEVG